VDGPQDFRQKWDGDGRSPATQRSGAIPDASIQLVLHGPVTAGPAGGRAVAVGGARSQALVAYLALAPGRCVPRTELAALLWPDRGEEQARASLRQELSVLRRVLGEDVLVADRSTVRLSGRVEILPPEAGTQLLAGLDLASAPFEEWLGAARRADAAVRGRDSRAGAAAALEAGDGRAAEWLARVALDLDSYDEEAMRLWLRAAQLTGDRLAALDGFARFRAALRDDLQAEPEAETAALADALRQGAPLPAGREQAGTVASGPPTIAVLAFEDLSAEAPDMFATGIVEEITVALSRVHEFHVIARQSAFALRGQGLDVPETARRLGADYLVEGTVRRAGDRVRLSVQLVRGVDGHTLWSSRFDDRIDDLFDLQDRIAALVAGRVAPNLRSAEIARAGGRPPADRSSYDLMLTAFPHFWAHGREENATAIRLLASAVERDPGNAFATAMLAWAHAQQSSYMWSADPEAERATALALADRAAAAVTDHAPTLTAIGAAISLAAADAERANAFIDRAIDIDPNNAWAWMRRGWARAYDGLTEEACLAMDRAELLSPLDPFRFNMLLGRAAALFNWTDHKAEAVALIEQALRLNPRAHWCWRMLMTCYFRMGEFEKSRVAGRRLLQHYPDLTIDYVDRSLPPWGFKIRAEYLESFRASGVPEA
jgi:TolB-like protein